MSDIENCRKPKGYGGVKKLRKMNEGHHAELSEWAFTKICTKEDFDCADLGCGGGANVGRLLSRCSAGTVKGLDYSSLSVSYSRRYNKHEIKKGRCQIVQGNVMSLPFDDSSFDLVTAFETIYFWPSITEAFKEVHRVLKAGGIFAVCNEDDGLNPERQAWASEIDNLTLYVQEEIETAMKDAGFAGICTETESGKPWILIVASKAE